MKNVSDIKWIKITTDMFEDEKIDFISSLPEADSIVVIWIRLLTLAGKCNAGGYVFLTEKIPYTDEMLAHKFKKQLNTVKLALETFRKLEMIEMDEHGIFLSKWEKHQEVDKLERIKEQTRARVADHRNRKKLQLIGGNVTVTDAVTESNAVELELELDIDKEKDIKNTMSDFEQFWAAYPRKLRKQDSIKIWDKILKDKKNPANPVDIITAASNYAAECRRKGTLPDYMMHPPTFLNKDRWRDYLTIDESGISPAQNRQIRPSGKPDMPVVKDNGPTKEITPEEREKMRELARKLKDGK